jgi:hypothetical protein
MLLLFSRFVISITVFLGKELVAAYNPFPGRYPSEAVAADPSQIEALEKTNKAAIMHEIILIFIYFSSLPVS